MQTFCCPEIQISDVIVDDTEKAALRAVVVQTIAVFAVTVGFGSSMWTGNVVIGNSDHLESESIVKVAICGKVPFI
jgi:hypothetical protein